MNEAVPFIAISQLDIYRQLREEPVRRPRTGWLDNRWWPSVLELCGPHGLEEGKR